MRIQKFMSTFAARMAGRRAHRAKKGSLVTAKHFQPSAGFFPLPELSAMRLLIAAVTLSVCGFAQEFRATISGRVTDAAGAAVANARVEIKSRDTGQLSMSLTSEEGAYQVSFLIPGNYVVSVEKPGFKKTVREGVRLEIAQHGVLDLELALGEVTQSVTVSENVRALETESADRGATFESRRVLEVPLMGRNPFSQAWSSPGVVQNASTQRLRPFDIAGSSSMVIGGGRPSANEVLVDGISSLFQASSVSYVPTAEAMSEFRVQTTNFDAQYGWTLGGVVNIITKNGTNQFHGSAFEFFQNTHLNANTFNQNLTGVGRSSSHINTFGADVSGPIRKNKLFFTYTFEDIRQVIPDPFVTSIPTSLQRQGDFSQTYYSRDSSGNPLVQAIYDPFSTTAGSSGALTRTPFAGNVIPSSRLDPIAVKVFSYLPSNSVPGDPLTRLNNLTNNGSTHKFTDFFPENTARVDWNINPTTRLFVRYSRNALQEERGFHYSTTSAINPADTGNNNPFTRENHNATIQFTKTFSPTLVLDVRAGLERFKSESGAGQGAGVGPSTLGFSSTFVSQAANFFPKFNWANYEGAGAQPTYTSPIAQTNPFEVTVAKQMGRDSVKFGGEIRWIRGYSQNAGFNAGNFSFDQLFTGANPLQIASSSGNALASFLLGTPQSGFIQVASQPARQEKLYSLFFQNDIRLTAKLKVNLGVRWDYLGPMTDRFNELPRGFAFTTKNPISPASFPVYGGVLFSGVGGNPRGIFNSSFGNFGPRLGVAYQLDAHTVLRGGYALVYGQTFNDPGNAPGFTQTTNMVTSIQAGVPANILDNPFPTGILQPAGSSLGLLTALGQSYQFADPAGGAPPLVHQFSFEIQRELPARLSGFGRLRWQPLGPDSGHPAAQRASDRSPGARHDGFVAERAQPLRGPFAGHVAERRHGPAAAATGPVSGVPHQRRDRGVPADRKVQLQLCADCGRQAHVFRLELQRLIHHFQADRPDQFRQPAGCQSGAGHRFVGYPAECADQLPLRTALRFRQAVGSQPAQARALGGERLAGQHARAPAERHADELSFGRRTDGRESRVAVSVLHGVVQHLHPAGRQRYTELPPGRAAGLDDPPGQHAANVVVAAGRRPHSGSA